MNPAHVPPAQTASASPAVTRRPSRAVLRPGTKKAPRRLPGRPFPAPHQATPGLARKPARRARSHNAAARMSHRPFRGAASPTSSTPAATLTAAALSSARRAGGPSRCEAGRGPADLHRTGFRAAARASAVATWHKDRVQPGFYRSRLAGHLASTRLTSRSLRRTLSTAIPPACRQRRGTPLGPASVSDRSPNAHARRRDDHRPRTRSDPGRRSRLSLSSGARPLRPPGVFQGTGPARRARRHRGTFSTQPGALSCWRAPRFIPGLAGRFLNPAAHTSRGWDPRLAASVLAWTLPVFSRLAPGSRTRAYRPSRRSHTGKDTSARQPASGAR